MDKECSVHALLSTKLICLGHTFFSLCSGKRSHHFLALKRKKTQILVSLTALFWHQLYVGIFLPHRQFSGFLDTSGVSWSSVDFWPCGLPRSPTCAHGGNSGVTCASDRSAASWFPQPLRNLSPCQSSSQSSGNSFLITPPARYRSIEDADVHWARCGRALNTSSCAHGVWRAPPSLFVAASAGPDTVQTSTLGIFTQASLRGHGWLNNCPEVGGWGWKFPPNHNLVPLATSLKLWLSRGFPGIL